MLAAVVCALDLLFSDDTEFRSGLAPWFIFLAVEYLWAGTFCQFWSWLAPGALGPAAQTIATQLHNKTTAENR